MDKSIVAAENPYLCARREWNERYGSYIEAAKKWRLVALLALGITLIAVGGLVYLGAQNKLVPYIVTVDKLGSMVPIKSAEPIKMADDRVIKAMLARFIVNFRSVISDGAAQKLAVSDAYALLAVGDTATTVISEYFQSGHSPFERAKDETVTVEISSVLPISKKTWQIEWHELVRDRRGVPKENVRMKALVTIAIIPPDTQENIMKNPIGLYIKDISWSVQF